MIRTVDRYIGKAAILGILLVWISLTLLMMMFKQIVFNSIHIIV